MVLDVIYVWIQPKPNFDEYILEQKIKAKNENKKNRFNFDILIYSLVEFRKTKFIEWNSCFKRKKLNVYFDTHAHIISKYIRICACLCEVTC